MPEAQPDTFGLPLRIPLLIRSARALLNYTTERGIKVQDSIPEELAEAENALARGEWDPKHEVRLYAAQSTLAAIRQADRAASFQISLTVVLIVVISVLSVFSFQEASVSANLRQLIRNNDTLALRIHHDAQSIFTADQNANAPAHGSGAATGDGLALYQSRIEALRYSLARFEAANQAIQEETQHLTLFSPFRNPSSGVSTTPEQSDTAQESAAEALPFFESIATYERIRFVAESTQRSSALFWGPVSNFVLPVLYAVLGALAFGIRHVARHMSEHYFISARIATSSRLAAAVTIGLATGAVLSSLSLDRNTLALALAFMAGYFVDLILEGILSRIETLFGSPLKEKAVHHKLETDADIISAVLRAKTAGRVAIIEYVSQKRASETAGRELDLAYSRLSTREVLQVRGVDRFLVTVFGVIALIVWATQLIPGLAVPLISSAHARAAAASSTSVSNPIGFQPPIGIRPEVWNVMVIVMFAVFILIALSFLWKGYFAKTKSEKAASFIDRFATLVLGVFLGKSVG